MNAFAQPSGRFGFRIEPCEVCATSKGANGVPRMSMVAGKSLKSRLPPVLAQSSERSPSRQQGEYLGRIVEH